MNRFLMLLGVAAVAGMMYVAAASGSQQSRGVTAKQFTALKKQVADLKQNVSVLKTQLGAVSTSAAADTSFISKCLVSAKAGALPVSDFGDGQNNTFGYTYFDGTNTFYTSALDIDGSGTPEGYLQLVDPSCAPKGLRQAQSRTGKRPLPHLSEHVR